MEAALAENGITTSVAVETAGSRGWFGWLADWLQGLAEAEQASLQLHKSEDGRSCDEREEDLRFAAFMTGPLY